eukprot:364800-Chlamydomonas_euryale.AAC.3
MNVADAYQHPLFNPEIDRRTGFRTRRCTEGRAWPGRGGRGEERPRLLVLRVEGVSSCHGCQ